MTPDLSYVLGGRRKKERCEEDNRWDEQKTKNSKERHDKRAG